MDPLHLPYPSRRVPVYARRGMVATSQPLAAEAGLAILREGGNAVDAAVATAAALTVLEPTSNGIGSDAFALVWTGDGLVGLNASGPAPARLTLDQVRQQGHGRMPARGVLPVTVPGAPAAWVSLVRRFGRLPLRRVLAPAIQYAADGFPVSPTVARDWQKAYQVYRDTLTGPEFAAWFDTFAPVGRPPAAGDLWRSPGHTATLQDIAETEGESFYRGRLAAQIDAFFHAHHGWLRADDLAAYEPEWVEPVGVPYRGYTVWELPPNSQGLIALLALRILGEDVPPRDTELAWHRAIEALKLAFIDGLAAIADPRHVSVPVARLLDPAHAAARRTLIGDAALHPAPGHPPRGGTVYLAAADGDGMMVSYIQSNYMGFGSGLVVPGTGIALQNRGALFSLDPDHPNCLAPGKRPYHTIIPGFLTQGDRPVGPFGVMGGFMQPQGHLQVLLHMLAWDLNPQAALDAPRWQWITGRTVELEYGTPEAIFEGLQRRGHDVRWATGHTGFGRGQIIRRLADGVLMGATEPRADGHVAAW
jgi:gamma-glutamyltranspeptidase/glutathione hydrolase